MIVFLSLLLTIISSNTYCCIDNIISSTNIIFRIVCDHGSLYIFHLVCNFYISIGICRMVMIMILTLASKSIVSLAGGYYLVANMPIHDLYMC